MSGISKDRKPVGFGTHITAGGIAGAMEAVRSPYMMELIFGIIAISQLCCQPLDTIKVRMQLSKSGRAPGVRARAW